MENNNRIVLTDTLEIKAETRNLTKVLAFIKRHLDELDCPLKIRFQIEVAVEEIFVNIAKYAYAPGIGRAEIVLELREEPAQAVIRFIDEGIPYDPLMKEDPDTSLSAEERQIGGLGIFLTKKAVDDISYEYKDGKNILTLVKNL